MKTTPRHLHHIEDNEEFVNKIVKIGEKFMEKHNI